jgi:beta-lactamase superfamily II metal-dependent hydrolase
MRKLVVVLVIAVSVVLLLPGCAGGEETRVTPVDETPPVISGVSASNITETSATITWTTDELATSKVTCWRADIHPAIVGPIVYDDKLVTSHSVSLSSLEPDTIYHFRVRSEDEAGNEAASEEKTFTTAQPTLNTLIIHFIDVGQGDAILIDLGDTEVLIDGGDRSPSVVEYLNEYVNGALEVIVATHPHADHIGGFIAVLNTFEVQQVWHNGDTSTSQTYSDFMDAVQAEGAEVHMAHRGDEIEAGGLTFTVLNPATLAATTNNNSIVLSLSYGEVDFLFTGDAEQEAEADMLAAGIVPDVEILKVGHHGSRTASSASFLAAAHPEVAVYMAGVGNTYGHPHAETISALEAIGASIYGTDVNGTVVVSTNGETYDVQAEVP